MADRTHVFISYARADAHYAERLERDLRANGFATWRDTRDLDPSQDFTGEIEEAIRSASHMVVCLTTDVKRRANSWVRREIAYALAQDQARRKLGPLARLPIIPVVFSGGELPILISTWIAIFVECDEDYSRCLSEVLERLRHRGGPVEEASYADPPDLVTYLNALHEWTSIRLQESVHTLITLAAADTPRAVEGRPTPTFTFNFAVSPVLSRETPTSPVRATLPALEPAEPLIFPSFAEAFQYHGGRVLLLGTPGAGKTTTLLAFARDAAVERLNDPTQPIPVLASIHTWDHQTPIPQWAQSQAQGADLTGQRLLYLLDGLDELGGKRPIKSDEPESEQYDPRAWFIQKLQAQLPTDPVVVASRITDYEQIGQKMILPGAVTLQLLTNAQIRDYLLARGQPELWKALGADSALMAMARTPLLLSLLTIAFRREIGEPSLDLTDLDEARIFDRYIHSRFVHEMAKPEPLPFDEPSTREMLGKLAIRMWRDWWSPGVTLSLSETGSIPGTKSKAFVSFGRRMHFLREASPESIQFVHLKLRDYCAVPHLLSALHNRNRSIRRDAIRALIEIGWQLIDRESRVTYYVATRRWDECVAMGTTAVPGLLEVLHDQDSDVRQAATGALGQIGDAAVPSLLEALHDQDSDVRQAAAEALGQIGDAAAVPNLLEALHDQNRDVRQAAAGALGQIGDTAAVPGLLEALRDWNRDVRQAAAEALGQIGGAAVPSLLEVLGDQNSDVRQAAAEALRQIGDVGIPSLLKALHDRNKGLRQASAKALEQIGWQPSEVEDKVAYYIALEMWNECTTLGATAVPSLLNVLKEKGNYARLYAARVLGQIGDTAAVPGLIEALRDSSAFVRWVAAGALERIGTLEALAAVKEWRRREQDSQEEEKT